MFSSRDLLALQMLDGVGDQTLRKLISSQTNASELESMTDSELRSVFSTDKGLKSFKEDFLSSLEKADYELEKFYDSNIEVVAFGDARYSKNLALIEDFPIFLYCIGNVNLLSKDKNIAVIGTRDN